MDTQLLKMTGRPEDDDTLEHAAELLDSGQLIAVPTETVYGIAASVTAGGIDNLELLKNDRDANKHYSIHLTGPSSIREFVPKINLRSYKLIYNILPGPVTLIFDVDDDHIEERRRSLGSKAVDTLYKNNTVGVRCPHNSTTSRLLAYTETPIIATSANPTDSEPATSAEEVMEYFNGKIAAVIDAGACRYKVSSTVVKLTDFVPSILREGSITREEIIRKSRLHVMFVCSGNTCRSPMAAGFCRKILAGKIGCDVDQLLDFGYKISSGGVMAPVAQPASPGCVAVCSEAGVDLSRHETTGLTESDIMKCDLIYVMTARDRQRITDFYPAISPKCRLLSEKQNIEDPIGGEMSEYRHCATQIIRALEKRIVELEL
ncbi:Low molecular weight protein-tyrosine-phosphatase YwlE [Limihaloglobus sulfuriphilus]|uniref:L-threonylcarbamoyladenylate synthase n=1 Tax=Limihaloglobus sulfuriphilus TaxID=1851148 RepID=A0A1Q2MCR0_9BACT|nr:L-threonylcarbamoyladenylate synthase [Limihaloglobus sulfuriphilus]AQQ70460.1 Low molecular weight protein-tyrosine-phosphatase YwlE [Limihaloglobus sulfuriphilus]